MSEKSRLFYVPIMHTSYESSGPTPISDEAVLRFYRGVNSFVNRLPSNSSTYLIFNDSLTSREVNMLNTSGGQQRFLEHLRTSGLTPERVPQDHVIARLLAKKARLVTIEDPSLLAEQSALVRAGGRNSWSDQMSARFEELNKLRDKKIASEVEKALKNQRQSTGILFLGAAHEVDKKLDAKGVPYTIPTEIFEHLSPEEIDAIPLLARFKK